MSRHRLLSVLAALAICAAPNVQAQPAAPAARDTAAAARQVPRPAPVAAAKLTQRDTAVASRSVTEKLFEAGWVVFPARLALVIVFSTVAMLLLTGASWVTFRLAHSMRHLRWKEPPRRLKKGELGAAGTTLGWEFEDQSSRDRARDAERDQQIAALHQSVEQLSLQYRELITVFVETYKSSRRR